MKKYVKPLFGFVVWFSLLLTPFIVYSCDCGCDTVEDAPPEKALVVSQEHLRVQAGYDESGKHMRTERLRVHKWRYEGHQYLEFRHYGTDGPGWVHDPDCPCHGTTTSYSSGLSEYQKIFGGL